MLRQWVQRYRPLRRTKEELDHIEPHANSLFQTGQIFFQQGNAQVAEDQLRLALQTNPNHLKAKLLLGQILLERNELTETVQILEEAYAYDPGTARPDLLRALLSQATKTESEADQLEIYDRVFRARPIPARKPQSRKQGWWPSDGSVYYKTRSPKPSSWPQKNVGQKPWPFINNYRVNFLMMSSGWISIEKHK